MKKLFLFLFIFVFLLTKPFSLSFIQSRSTSTNGLPPNPTWGVSVGDVYEFKLDIYRRNGTPASPGMIMTFGDFRFEFEGEEDTWNFTIVEINSTGVWANLKFKNETQGPYTSSFFIDTHADNMSYWGGFVENQGYLNATVRSFYSNTSFLKQAEYVESYLILKDQSFFIDVRDQYQIQKGIRTLFEVHFNVSYPNYPPNDPDHLRIVGLTISYLNISQKVSVSPTSSSTMVLDNSTTISEFVPTQMTTSNNITKIITNGETLTSTISWASISLLIFPVVIVRQIRKN